MTIPTHHALLIPVDFALGQIESVVVSASLKKLKHLHQKLISQALAQPELDSLQVTDAIHLNLEDFSEIFSGRYGDLISSKGVRIIQRLYTECVLEIHRPPTPFPKSLLDYIAADVSWQCAQPNSQLEQAENRITDIKEHEFTYGRLFYLFDSIVGNAEGEVTLKLCGKPVTRKLSSANNDSMAQFIWENDDCRTQTLTKGRH